MNKTDLIERLKVENGLTKNKAEAIVDIFFGQMGDALSEGDRVEIRGFCSFFVKEYRGYTGRNPKTGETTRVLPKRLPFFKCGTDLKKRVDYEIQK